MVVSLQQTPLVLHYFFTPPPLLSAIDSLSKKFRVKFTLKAEVSVIKKKMLWYAVFGVTDEESFLQEISGVSVHEAAAISVSGT